MGSIPTPGANARIGSAEIGLNVQNSNPPTSAYVGKDDSLWIMCASNTFAVTVTVNARYLMPDGSIQLNQYALAFSTNRSATFKPIQLPECFLLSVACVPNLFSGNSINVYVAAIVSRFAPSAFNAAQILCQGYSNLAQPISWPTGVNTTSVDCAGTLISVGTSAPAVGNNFSTTVPSNAKWRPISMSFILTCSATVANRIVTITMDDGANIFSSVASSIIQTAGQGATYTMNAGALTQNASAIVVTLSGFLGQLLYPAYRIRSFVNGLQAGDQISAVVLLVEEWLLP